MITVEYAKNGTTYILRVTGHAGAAPKGEDTVCSAASILIYTAAQCALELYSSDKLRQWPMTELESGNNLIAADARREHRAAVAQTFDTVMTGFRLLQHKYPQFVVIKESSPV